MTITLHYAADYKALIDTAETAEDREAIEASYEAYTEYVVANGITVDRESSQITYCTKGGEWPDDVKTFWDWYNS